MNKVSNAFLYTGAKFMPELYLKQPGFTQSADELSLREKCPNTEFSGPYFPVLD